MKLTPIITCLCIVTSMSSNAAVLADNLAGLLNTTAAATNSNRDRQYAWNLAGSGATAGATITVAYTLRTSGANLSTAFANDNLFRYTGGSNMGSGQDLEITIDSISVNSGWILNSVSMTDTVTIAINGGDTARFSVNGGATFDYLGTGSGVSQQNFTDSRFQSFNGAGDSLSFLNVNQTANGGMNLRNLGMSFDITAVPEPGAALLGSLGLLVLFRRRR